MNQQQKEWSIFGHVLTTSDLGIYIFMFVVLLSGVAGIWVGPIADILIFASIAAFAVLVWRTTIKHKVIRITLFVLETFIWTSALAGGIGILQGTNPYLQVAWLADTPFSDYTIPGLLLVIVVGGSALLAAATVFIQREWAVLVSLLAGQLMAGYEVVEAIIIDSKVGNVILTTLVTQLVFFVPGLVIFGLAGFIWVRDYRPQHFHLRHASHA
jgi:hypothetical protein